MSCPHGHDTTATDYCDVCGIAMDAPGAAGPDSSPEGTGTLPVTEQIDTSGGQNADGTCPNCRAANPPNALFCEACGYDFTTGSMPRPVSAPDARAVTPTADANPSPELTDGWVAEIWIDPDWYADQKSTDPLPSPGLPVVVPLKHQSILIGRASRSRNITPDIDLSSDSGISRRHAQLTTDGKRWFVEDLGSSNGTYVAGSVDALPTEAIPQGQEEGDRCRRPGLSRCLDPDRGAEGVCRRDLKTGALRKGTNVRLVVECVARSRADLTGPVRSWRVHRCASRLRSPAIARCAGRSSPQPVGRRPA